MMDRKLTRVLIVALTVHVISARVTCPSHPNCVCGGTFAIELNCNLDGGIVKINFLPNTYITINCENATTLDYSQLPKCVNESRAFQSVSFKDCPLPNTSFKDVFTHLGVSKTMSLIFQNAKRFTNCIDRKHFAGLHYLTKLLLSINGATNLPDNLFMDINNLTWLNIRCNNIKLSEELLKPLGKLETLEITHNYLTNISTNLFSHLTFLRKLSLWQSNVTEFSKDFFSGIDVLEELDLSSNGLNELPTSIFKPLKKLKILTLFSNKLSTLPRYLFKTNNKLETVVILNNDVKMKELPKGLLGNLPNLKQVYIQRSGIEVIPYDIFTNSSRIANISFAYNDIAVLPESTFNYQIFLLELDLSHNNLQSLKPKLFSSLVRLEKLDLSYNSIEELSGYTFSSLLSLLFLNMEHNKLKIISSYLFDRNKLRMSISLAYNELDFENKDLQNDSNAAATQRSSPFINTYNLKMLNLSHNKFKTSFDDWWINGHEYLDISSNSLKYLWRNEKCLLKEADTPSYEKLIKRPMKAIWIRNNPLECECINFRFADYLNDILKTEVLDNTLIQCSIWKKRVCSLRFIIFLTIFSTSITFIGVLIMIYMSYKEQIYLIIKKKLQAFFQQDRYVGQDKNIIVNYSENDEEFVLKEVLPELKQHNNYNVHAKCINNQNKGNFTKQFKKGKKDASVTLVIFSPNYLTSVYSHVNIKKIRGEILKAKNTVYVFADIGPENSIYAFLKEQRDQRTTILWSDPNFWSILICILSNGTNKWKKRIASEYDSSFTMDKSFDSPKRKLMSNDQFTTMSDWPAIYSPNAFENKQV